MPDPVLPELPGAIGRALDVGSSCVLRSAARLLGGRLRRSTPTGPVLTSFQPVVDLRTGAVVAHEALTRFPDRGDTAAVFAQAALAGVGPHLEERAARHALAAIRAWAPGVPVSVNLSPEALLLPSVRSLLLHHRGDDVVVEITEHAAVRDYTVLLEVLGELRAAGLGLAVDDVGAGYASLQHVLLLHPDTIKIDISIVAGLHQDPARAALLSALATFAAETGSRLLAEGVEEPAERDALLASGVHLAQGHLFGAPAPAPAR